ncbi:hypothetical protein VL20_1634 [Microcystis panniformis FACHB-1757]|uniref:Uncharacterized protein n=1 Tax=Microcystis panniformis FACHB-1757 TaxID=1638788 RepID=A0A0K1RYA4_9CHRO|nr:hypothetical protein VL20_1634 [Microcystis panniformis FACHB-1757]
MRQFAFPEGRKIKSGKRCFGDAEKAAGKYQKKFTFLSGD